MRVSCKGIQGGKDAESGKGDDFSEFDQEFDNDGNDDDSDFGYVTTPDQEPDAGQQGEKRIIFISKSKDCIQKVFFQFYNTERASAICLKT